MTENDYVSIGVKISNAEIIEKLTILQLEYGISSNSFIIRSIAEKLKREGYLTDGVKQHERKEQQKPKADDLMTSLRKIDMTRK